MGLLFWLRISPWRILPSHVKSILHMTNLIPLNFVVVRSGFDLIFTSNSYTILSQVLLIKLKGFFWKNINLITNSGWFIWISDSLLNQTPLFFAFVYVNFSSMFFSSPRLVSSKNFRLCRTTVHRPCRLEPSSKFLPSRSFGFVCTILINSWNLERILVNPQCPICGILIWARPNFLPDLKWSWK